MTDGITVRSMTPDDCADAGVAENSVHVHRDARGRASAGSCSRR